MTAESIKKNMKTTHLLVTLIAASLPLSALLAEDTANTEMAGQNSETTAMKATEMSQMMSNSKDQDAELDKLVTEMNNALPDKKLDAIAAVLTQLVEQRKAIHEQMQKMMSANEKDGMDMCRKMMGCVQDGKHSTHH